MGNVASTAKLWLAAVVHLRQTYDLFQKRVQASPGLPAPNPTLPYWSVPPSTVSSSEEPLPESADVVVIGSGITGASFVYNLLGCDSNVHVIMLEAREVCSGATARNGGHLNPPLYHDYSELKEKHGKQAAKTIIRFRLQHLQEIRRIAEHEDVLKQSQCRETEHIDVFTDADDYARAKERLAKWKADMPSESDTFGFCDQEEAIKRYRLADDTIGCIYGSGGAMHPYRLVTSLLALLLDRHSGHFCIATQTPCTDISGPTSSSHQYTVTTPRGSIKALHVIHATNGWCSHLLPPLRAKIVPARGTMSAQRPGTLLAQSTLSGLRSYVFYRGTAGYDYLTQLPNGEHELMFGGGFAQCYDDADIPDIGLADDATVPFSAACHLAGALPLYFGSANWGGESAPTGEQDARWGTGRTKAQWSGVLGVSTDSLPWVGRLPEKVAGRPSPSAQGLKEGKRLAAPGEWIAAGYSGEGMVHAWMSGKALAYMVLDREEEITEWFPDILRVTEKRWKKATVDDLISKFM